MNNQELDQLLETKGLEIRDLYRSQRLWNAYRCINNCHVRLSDNAKLKDRCPKCGAWMMNDGVHTIDSVDMRTQEIQRSHKGETGQKIKLL